MKKIYKEIVRDEFNKITFYGANRYAEIRYTIPRKKENESKPYFIHYGNREYLDEFLMWNTPWTGVVPDYMKEFHAMKNDSFFSGVVIKLSDCGESVKAFTFIS